MTGDGVRIRALDTLEEYKICEQVQQAIWGAEPVEVVPADLLITAQRHGGLVLGAFDPGGEMVGCLFGFAGRPAADNPLTRGVGFQHCSHITGVLANWRGKGIGYRLKDAQRVWALSEGYSIITWTFNPLETANATLNIGKLGAVCACYLRNVYGALPDALNQGLLSDRFEVVWQISSERVASRFSRGWSPPQLSKILDFGSLVLNSAVISKMGWLKPGAIRQPSGEWILIEVPMNFQRISVSDPELAHAWQLNVREACEVSFESGYAVHDVVRHDDIEHPRFFYLLGKQTV